MEETRFANTFEGIYATDLVYAPDCWKLCGDAHCCNFTRYKSKMSMIGKGGQELPLLPGEMDFLKARGWTAHFGEFEHRVIEFPLTRSLMKLEFLVSASHTCACQHDTRTTVCRLYPLLPMYDVDGRLIGVDTHFGIYEEIEAIDQMERACKIDRLPFGELNKFITICNLMAQNPTHVFYVMAFQLAKAFAVQRLREARQSIKPGVQVSTLRIFEGMFALKQLLDGKVMRAKLDELADQFQTRYGESFTIA
jgi:hypothetical protein